MLATYVCCLSVNLQFTGKLFFTLLTKSMYFQVPNNADTSGSSPHFLLATGGGDNLVKLWNIFTGSGKTKLNYSLYIFHHVVHVSTIQLNSL